MKTKFTLAILALASAVGAVQATEPARAEAPATPAAVLENAPAGTVVFDDDGGRAQIIPRRPVDKRAASYHGGPVVSGGNVEAIFLGGAWRETANRSRETRALEALTGGGKLSGLAHEDLLDPLEAKSVSDLEVQRRLDALVTSGTAAPVDAGTVYVLFLAPGLRSTLGQSDSEKDYSAYHNHYHSAAGVVRYVVVPYDAEASRWLSSARASLAQALVNPEGNAWY